MAYGCCSSAEWDHHFRCQPEGASSTVSYGLRCVRPSRCLMCNAQWRAVSRCERVPPSLPMARRAALANANPKLRRGHQTYSPVRYKAHGTYGIPICALSSLHRCHSPVDELWHPSLPPSHFHHLVRTMSQQSNLRSISCYSTLFCPHSSSPHSLSCCISRHQRHVGHQYLS